MSHSEEPSLRPRQTVQLPVSFRTLQHPSFLPLYILHPAGFHRQTHHTVHPIIPEELFYSDPTMSCGLRIWNIQTRVFSRSQLNVPQPIMSACVAPPNHPDPFRSGPHPTRDLGCPTWRIQSARPPAQPRRAVIQLTQEEDQAVTNLLKLYHQEAPEGSVPPAPRPDLSGPAESGPGCSSEEAHEAVGVDEQRPTLKWRRQQFEAAPLLRGTALQDADSVRATNKTVLDRPLHRSTKTPPKYYTSSAVTTRDAENGDGCGHVWSVQDERESNAAAPWRSLNPKKRSRPKEQLLTESEEDAVFVLLNLGDAVTSGSLQ